MRSTFQGYQSPDGMVAARGGGSAGTINSRLGDRGAQDRGWAAPLPDTGHTVRAIEQGAPRQRVEWDTRSSINNRFYESVQISGPTAVTAAMLATHPTHGVQDQLPSASRVDKRMWSGGADTPYFPDVTGPGQRPMMPSSSVWANPHFDGWNPESTDTARELRFVVKEDNRFRGDDTSLRVAQRSFEHQWMPPVSVEQLAVAERLRPTQDDYRRPVAAAPGGSFQIGGQWSS